MKFSLARLRLRWDQHWKWYVAGIVTVMILITGFIRAITPDAPVVNESTFITTNLNNTTTQYHDITFVGREPLFPEKLPLAVAEPQNIAASQLEAIFINAFKLKQHDRAPNLWIGDTHSLTIQETTSEYTLSANTTPPTTETPVTAQQAIIAADAFLDEYFPNLSLVSQVDDIVFYSHVYDVDPSDNPAQAQVAVIPYTYEIEGYPVFYRNQGQMPFRVWVSGDGEVLKVSFFPHFLLVGEESEPVELLSLEQSLDNINEDSKASIVAAETGTSRTVSLIELSSGSMTSVKLEYRHDPTTNQIYPFYRFAGTAMTGTGYEIDVEIVTPAVGTRGL